MADDISDGDLDDILDSALDEFQETPAPAKTAPPAAAEAKPAAASAASAAGSSASDNAAGGSGSINLSDVMRELGLGAGSDADEDVVKQMEAAFSFMQANPDFANMLQEMAKNIPDDLLPPAPEFPPASAAAAAGSSGVGGSSSSKKPAAEPASKASKGSMDDKVNETLNRLRQQNEQTARAGAPQGDFDMPDPIDMDSGLQALMQMLEQGGDSSGGAGLDAFLQSMMGQLLSKDILYEPMKELSDKYPAYLRQHGPSLPTADLERYQKQLTITTRIVALFDASENPDPKVLMELMQEMQETGAPPAALLHEIAPNLELSSDGLPKLPPGLDGENCSVM